jgi:hypothetical protein
MNGPDVYAVLQAKGISRLYHANSVTTSRMFLQQGALVSRGSAEANRLPQTPQYTDNQDKAVGVWHDVFLDTDDFHRRISNANKYGPVLFVMDSRVLTALPAGSQVLVTRSNPSKWSAGQSQAQRYYGTAAELQAELTRGTMDQMITVRTPNGVLPFGQWLIEVVLDNPQAQRSDHTDAFNSSRQELAAAASGGVSASINARTCNAWCKCAATYRGSWGKWVGYF